MSVSVKGHDYYEIPEEIKYRYPAPGSCPLDQSDHPNLYKKHWKTPFRESNYNIRQKEKTYTTAENTDHFIAKIPAFDSADGDFERLANLQQAPNTDDLKLAEERDAAPDSEEMIAEMWAKFEGTGEKTRIMSRDYATGHWDLDEEYDQQTFLVGGYEKDYSGISNDWRMRQICTEFEYWIEEVLGEKRIREKKFKMYKGQVKKWQILDDETHDRDQIEKLQAAVQAPLPEELEMYREQSDKWFIGVVNNENTRLWRDAPLATDTPDFDPDFLQIDREKRRKYFIERYEQPKQLQ